MRPTGVENLISDSYPTTCYPRWRSRSLPAGKSAKRASGQLCAAKGRYLDTAEPPATLRGTVVSGYSAEDRGEECQRTAGPTNCATTRHSFITNRNSVTAYPPANPRNRYMNRHAARSAVTLVLIAAATILDFCGGQPAIDPCDAAEAPGQIFSRSDMSTHGTTEGESSRKIR